MADYSHHHVYRVARRSHEAGAQRLGWLLAALAVLMLAILAWVWMQQRSVQSAPTAQPASAYRPQAAVPAPVRTTPIATPPSAAVAAAGDTRPLR